MKLVYIDESGYLGNWKDNIESSPYLVVSAFSIDAFFYQSASEDIIKIASRFGMNFSCGNEVKSKDIFGRVASKIKNNHDPTNEEKEFLLSILSFPRIYDGVAWSVIFDKKTYLERYPNETRGPHALCISDLLERIQSYLIKKNDCALVIFDQNKKFDDEFFLLHTRLVSNGSNFPCGSSVSRDPYTFKMERILDFYLANSKNSIGVKVADFLARATFQYLKLADENLDEKIFWKDALLDSLDKRENGDYKGWGLKYIPSRKS